MVYLDKNGKKVNKLGFNLILSERLRTLRKKVFSIHFFTMLGIWIIVYYQVTSHYHPKSNGFKYGKFKWETKLIIGR